MQNKYLFILGRTTNLCFSELKSVLSHYLTQITKITEEVVCVETEAVLPLEKLNSILGGIIKVGKINITSKTVDANLLSELLINNQKNSEKITFGLSFYGHIPPEINQRLLASKTKKILKEKNIPTRFVVNDEKALSSVTIEKQKARDLLIICIKDGFIIGETVLVQDFVEWNNRDFGRPEVDPKAGMLPLKVARMMLNLGLNWKAQDIEKGSIENSITVLDPFCGTGTILAEAGFLGLKTIGADISSKAIEKTTKNIAWLAAVYSQEVSPRLFVSDATHLSGLIADESIDLIVTEPFMGPLVSLIKGKPELKGQPLNLTEIKNVIKGLDKLYLGCFKEWSRLLKKQGKIIIAIPSLGFEGKDFLASNVIDNREKLGYTLTASSGSYNRPQAFVKRNIYIFEKK